MPKKEYPIQASHFYARNIQKLKENFWPKCKFKKMQSAKKPKSGPSGLGYPCKLVLLQTLTTREQDKFASRLRLKYSKRISKCHVFSSTVPQKPKGRKTLFGAKSFSLVKCNLLRIQRQIENSDSIEKFCKM